MVEIDNLFLAMILVGFVAQLIDGALGMAYGVSSTTALMALGMPPALASANVHTAEVFTSAASGGSHALARNVDWRLVWRLAPAGIAGAIVGTIIVSNIDTHLARPFIAAYLFYMGTVVLRKALSGSKATSPIKRVGVLGFLGGFCDTIGGGGWGPVVASRLIATRDDTLKAIGSTNVAEFFMTSASSVTFLITLGPTFGKAAIALIIGGVIAAPIAAFGAKRVPRRALMGFVGMLICFISAYNMFLALT